MSILSAFRAIQICVTHITLRTSCLLHTDNTVQSLKKYVIRTVLLKIFIKHIKKRQKYGMVPKLYVILNLTDIFFQI